MELSKHKFTLAIYLLFSSLFSGAIYGDSALRSLYDILSSFPENNPSSPRFLKKHTNINLPVRDDSNCFLQKTASLSSINYFGINCEGNLREGLISFSNQNKKRKIPQGSFVVIGSEKIGKKNYLKIASNLGVMKRSDSVSYVDDTEFSYEKKKVYKKHILKKSIVPRLSASNPNLLYFKDIAFDKNRRKEAPSGLEIFFDQTCPLKFLEVDESFYWDNTRSFVFEISCVKNSPYAIVKVPGNKRNKLNVSNLDSKTPERGDSFLARLKLRKLTNQQAYWEDFKIYYE